MPRPKANRSQKDPKRATRDSLDFRDLIYTPTLKALRDFLLPDRKGIHILNQGQEGACTGFGLAAVINYLLFKRGLPRGYRVSPYMLYEMAKRHDQWPGEDYEGSSARGAMKGWYKNGVCLEELWTNEVTDPGDLSDEARADALNHPLGSFYRVLPRRVDVHAALQEVEAVYVTAATHQGWDRLKDGLIDYDPSYDQQGGHAFAIIGYNDEGFLIQNSWGEDWGGVEFVEQGSFPGCAIWKYDDFDRNLWDAWVARLARPFESIEALRASTQRREENARGSRPTQKNPPRAAIRKHFIHIDDGQFDPKGDYFSTEGEVSSIIDGAVTGGAKHVLLYAHGGLNSVKSSAMRVHKWHPVFEANKVHEIHFLWETGLWEEIRDILLGKQEFVEERAGGAGDWWDNWFERVTGPLGRGLWKEMRSDAELAFAAQANAGSKVAEMLHKTVSALPPNRRPKLHLVGHSAGSIFLGCLLERWGTLANGGPPIDFRNLILFAPACTHDFFRDNIRPALQNNVVKGCHHFHLDDKRERGDNVAHVYHKSLLYLVSRSYQERGSEVPIMGMARYRGKLPRVPANPVRHHATDAKDPMTRSTSHGGFDNDATTMNSMLRLVLGKNPSPKFTDEELSGY
jgi:hypothetical protein